LSIIDEKIKEGKPLIVDFGSDTCAPCKMIKPVLEEIAEVYKDRLNVIILDVYENMEIAKEMGVMSVPTQFFYDSEGTVLGHHIGFIPKEGFDQIISEHLLAADSEKA